MASILIAQDGNELFEENARPGCKIAMIRAGESVNATRSRAAYQQCIEELNPDAEAVFDYTGSYTDSALNQQIVENMIKNQGVEVVGRASVPVLWRPSRLQSSTTPMHLAATATRMP